MGSHTRIPKETTHLYRPHSARQDAAKYLLLATACAQWGVYCFPVSTTYKPCTSCAATKPRTSGASLATPIQALTPSSGLEGRLGARGTIGERQRCIGGEGLCCCCCCCCCCCSWRAAAAALALAQKLAPAVALLASASKGAGMASCLLDHHQPAGHVVRLYGRVPNGEQVGAVLVLVDGLDVL